MRSQFRRFPHPTGQGPLRSTRGGEQDEVDRRIRSSLVLSGHRVRAVNGVVGQLVGRCGHVAARHRRRKGDLAPLRRGAHERPSVVATEHAVDGRIEAIEVFWRPGCPFVEGLGRTLEEAGVPTNLRNISENPDDAAIVRSIADGNETVPTLIIGPVALVNPSARLVMATLREHAPHLLDANG